MGWEGPLTERQMMVWDEWFDIEMNRPGRTEFYLMALRATLLNINRTSNSDKVVSTDEMKIPLTRGGQAPARDPKVVASWMKSRARGRFANLTVVNVRKDGTVINTEEPTKS